MSEIQLKSLIDHRSALYFPETWYDQKPKENSEFCFPEILNVSRGEAERNIEVERKQKSLFPAGRVIECFFFYLPTQN